MTRSRPTASRSAMSTRHELHRGAVGVGDDALVVRGVVVVDAHDHERHARLHAPLRGVVARRRAALRGLAARGRARRRHRPRRARCRRPRTRPAWPPRPATPGPRTSACGPPRATRAAAASPTGKPRSASTAIIVRPTRPVAPTTATVRPWRAGCRLGAPRLQTVVSADMSGAMIHRGAAGRTGRARRRRRAPCDAGSCGAARCGPSRTVRPASWPGGAAWRPCGRG